MHAVEQRRAVEKLAECTAERRPSDEARQEGASGHAEAEARLVRFRVRVRVRVRLRVGRRVSLRTRGGRGSPG